MIRQKKSSTVNSFNSDSGIVLAIISFIIPGLGQIISGKIKRGVLILVSMATLILLFIWRIHLLSHRLIIFSEKFEKAFSRSPFFIILILLALIVFWILNVIDNLKIGVKKDKKKGVSIFVLILFLFFAIGWQISEINIGKMVSEFPDAWPPLKKILWPWEAAVSYDSEEITSGAKILTNSDVNPPPPAIETRGEPFILSTPTFGNLSTMDESGSILHLEGKNFVPDTETQIWWKDSIGNAFRPRQDGEYVTLTTDSNGSFTLDLIMPYRLTPPSAEGQQIHTVEARQIFQIGGPKASDPLRRTIELMIQTIFMGMMATLFGIIFAIPVSFLASRNLMSGSKISMAVYFITRTILNIIRAIEPMIWALIAVVWVGLGPFAGIIALTIHSIAALGKLYSESIENIDQGQIEAIQATGATKLQTIMFAVIPQMIPPFISFTIYRWDINVRMSTIIGMVGGGGIGFLLVQYIRLLDYKAAGIAVWFIAITVSILDYVSAEIRNRFI